MKNKKIISDSDPYFKGGTLLVILGLITAGIGLSSYLYGTEEMWVYSGQGTTKAPAQDPHNHNSISVLITTIGISLTGIVMWIIGLIKKIRLG